MTGKECGAIVFSKNPIEPTVADKKGFSETFDITKDEIFGRAFWPHSLANYPLALDKGIKKFYFSLLLIKNPPSLNIDEIHHHHQKYLFFF